MTAKKASIFVHPAVDQPPPFEPIVAAGMKAIEAGTASPQQQQAVFEWLVKELGGIGKVSYRPDPYAMAFMEGRRFVAATIMYLVNWKEVKNG